MKVFILILSIFAFSLCSNLKKGNIISTGTPNIKYQPTSTYTTTTAQVPLYQSGMIAQVAQVEPYMMNGMYSPYIYGGYPVMGSYIQYPNYYYGNVYGNGVNSRLF